MANVPVDEKPHSPNIDMKNKNKSECFFELKYLNKKIDAKA